MLLMLIIYIAAILACLFFGENDPARFGSVAMAMLSLFQVRLFIFCSQRRVNEIGERLSSIHWCMNSCFPSHTTWPKDGKKNSGVSFHSGVSQRACHKFVSFVQFFQKFALPPCPSSCPPSPVDLHPGLLDFHRLHDLVRLRELPGRPLPRPRQPRQPVDDSHQRGLVRRLQVWRVVALAGKCKR